MHLKSSDILTCVMSVQWPMSGEGEGDGITVSLTSSHERKFLNEHANFVLIGTKLAHTSSRSCRRCASAGGEEA